jgi:glycolate oxidase
MMNPPTASDVLSLLVGALGKSVITEPEQLLVVQTDKSGQFSEGAPLCIVEATSTDDVVAVLKIASETATPVVTRGGGSGLAGGAIGGPGEIVLSLAKMNRIKEISVDDRWAVVEAGVINLDLNNAAREQGLWFAPDPASRHWSTVGGNIATNAGGLLCVKYGVTREAVLQLTVVLADGEIVQFGHQTVKGVSGFDLAALMVGSEGTLGVITEARVALKPLDPNPVWTISGRAADIQLATKSVEETVRQGRQPAILELMDAPSVQHVARYLGLEEMPGQPAQLIAQTDGAAAAGEAQAIAQIWRDCGLDVEVGQDREDLLHFRRSMHPAMGTVGQVLIEDIAVPRSRLGEMFAEIRRIEKEFNVEIPTVAHAGDGNLHPNFIYQGDSVPALIWDAADAMFRYAVSLGGTLTGEHGVGLLKRRWLEDELGPVQWKIHWGIKKLFDPQGILNPGKVFDPRLTLMAESNEEFVAKHNHWD